MIDTKNLRLVSEVTILIILSAGGLAELCVTHLLNFSLVTYILNEKYFRAFNLNEGEEYKLFLSYSLCGNRPSHICQDRALFLRILRQVPPYGPHFVIVIDPQFSRSLDVLLSFSSLAIKS